MTRFAARRAAAPAAAILAVFASAATVWAHDFWIVPNAFAVGAGSWLEALGQTSVKFPTSSSAVAPERVSEARVIGATSDERIADLSVAGKSLLLKHRPSTAGQRVVAVALVTRTSRAAPAGLKRYIALEGAPELVERYESEGLFSKPDSVTQKTTKYAKTVVEVGRGGPRAYAKTAGHALEFVPVTDPSSLRVGDTFAVRLLFRNQPLANAHVHAGAAPEAALNDSTALPADAKDRPLMTDLNGVLRVPIDEPGLWNLRTLHAAPVSAASPSEWEVAFATIVFRADASRQAKATPHLDESTGDVQLASPPTQSRGDSAAVAAVVDRFHAAIAAGDSTLALSLLESDAVVLESGGIETREEYRSHHLPADIAFAQAVSSERGSMRIFVRGDVAWASSTSTTTGEYRGRQVNSAGAELVVLARVGQEWKISAIHWSSRTRRAPGV
jgi:ketosteroid isomerase-like protein